MAVGAVKYRDFDDYLKKTGHDNDIKPNNNQVTGFTNGVANSAIKFAQDNDIFTAGKKFGPGQTPDKESSGSGAASSGGFLNNIVSGTATWIVNTFDTGNNTGDLAAAATGHTPTLQPLATPSGLTGASGNENSGPEGGATQGQPRFNAMDLYQQFLDAQREAQVADETGDKPAGEATLGGADSSGGAEGAGSATGAEGADGANGTGGANGADGAGSGAPAAGSSDVPGDNNPVNPEDSGNGEPSGEEDPANNTSDGINKQEIKKQEQLQQQKELEKLKQRQDDEEQ